MYDVFLRLLYFRHLWEQKGWGREGVLKASYVGQTQKIGIPRFMAGFEP